jgi:hypothetical protein
MITQKGIISVPTIRPNIILRPGNLRHAREYAAMAWVKRAIRVTEMDTNPEFSIHLAKGSSLKTDPKCSQCHVLGIQVGGTEKISLGPFSPLMAIQ